MTRDFIDTNVLVYAEDLDAGEKREVAQALVADLVSSGRGVVSTQVLQEYFVASRKLGVAAEHARQKVDLFAKHLHVVLIDPALVLAAIDLHRLHAISLWDALIVRAAAAAGCARLVSEDLQHGQAIGGVRVVNPFA